VAEISHINISSIDLSTTALDSAIIDGQPTTRIKMTDSEIYTGFKICKTLGAKEKCFRLEQSEDGVMKEIFHEHMPKHRISTINCFNFLRALLVRYSALGDPEILRTYINDNGKSPVGIELYKGHWEYPEAGVFRQYCDSGQLLAWYDEVINAAEFVR